MSARGNRRGTPVVGCRPLTDEEAEKCIKYLREERRYGDRDATLFIMQTKLGFRISEMLTLRVKDVWQYGKVLDRVLVPKRYMKGKQESRSALVPESAKPVIAAYVKKLQDLGYDQNGYLFASSRKTLVWDTPDDKSKNLTLVFPRGQKKEEKPLIDLSKMKYVLLPMSQEHCSSMFKSMAQDLEMSGHVGTHSCRKMYAEKVFELSGKNLVEVQNALGHKDSSTTAAYLAYNLNQRTDDIVRQL